MPESARLGPAEQDDSVLAILQEFKAGEEAYGAQLGAIDQDDDQAMEALIARTYGPPVAKLEAGLPPATTREGAIAALEGALYEMQGGVGHEETMVRAALAYLRST